MDKRVTRTILDELREIERLGDPRLRGKALTGRLKGFWCYRVGDWRIICDILDNKLVVLVVDVGDRKNIYR
jgi:mRNA interferase RelE/StbE